MNWAVKEHHHFKDHLSESMVFTRRVLLAFALVIALFAVLVARFYTLQVVHHDNYATISDRNRIQVVPIAPNRGLIFDRHGRLVADNRPSFTLSLVPERIEHTRSTLARLSQLIPVSEDDIRHYDKGLKQRRRPYEPVPLRYRLTEEEIAILAVNKYSLTGVQVEAQLVRYYPMGSLFAHAVGYVGRISEQELSRFDAATFERYAGTHSIGKSGIERYYERQLLGQAGLEYIEANAHGRRLRTLDEQPASAGNNVSLFLDSKVQAAATAALGTQRGALVMLDVRSGGVLAMVSTPSFDPNPFVTGISVSAYRALNESRDLPLFNRTTQGQYPPGSTLKPMLGLGGLEHSIVDITTQVRDPGFYQLPNDERLYRDWKRRGHGRFVSLKQALVESCDVYFYDLAFRMGVDRMHAFGRHFGLGETTRLDIPHERQGLWPSQAWKREQRGLPWFPGNSLNMSIGQGDVLTTPLQLAVMTATLATKGRRLKPRLVAKIGEQKTQLEEDSHYHGDAEAWAFIHNAMHDTVHTLRGTAQALGRKLDYTLAGKTGTAQVVGIAQDAEYDSDSLLEYHRDHTLFVGFAPAETPEVAIAVIVENGEKHGNTTFPVAKASLDAYFLAKPLASPMTPSAPDALAKQTQTERHSSQE